MSLRKRLDRVLFEEFEGELPEPDPDPVFEQPYDDEDDNPGMLTPFERFASDDDEFSEEDEERLRERRDRLREVLRDIEAELVREREGKSGAMRRALEDSDLVPRERIPQGRTGRPTILDPSSRRWVD